MTQAPSLAPNSLKLTYLIKGLLLTLVFSCQNPIEYDIVIRNGMIYNGSGEIPFEGDIAIQGDTIIAMGNLSEAQGKKEIDAAGLAVSPGFINMLSCATESLIKDGRSQSDIRQGITLEVFGEGISMGPLNDSMKVAFSKDQGDIQYEIDWTTLDQYLHALVKRGVSPNVASFVGATTLRIHEIGYEDRKPTEEELANMKTLVRNAMEEGAMGIGASLIYAPAFYAETEELIELAKVAAEYDGMYITHMRSEGNKLLEGVNETITIAREAGIRAEIYHLKAAGQDNWGKLDSVFVKIDSARKAGLELTTNMYTYTAGATGLDASMPPWVQEGGYEAWAERLLDPRIRRRVQKEMSTPTDQWENLYLAAGGAEGMILSSFKNDSLKYLTGKTLAEVAQMRGSTPEETSMDLVVEDGSRIGVVYFIMSEENVRKKISQKWMSFGSDAASLASEGVFLHASPHPRAYGNVARLLGKYVRDEKIIPLEEAIRKLTGLPAHNLKIKRRGLLQEGYFADIVVFDPSIIQDLATYERPHQYARGVEHVFVNGQQVIQNGDHTGATPGRFVRGPGWKP